MHIIDSLVEAFSRLPGIGPRQARRFVYHLLSASGSERSELSKLIENLSSAVSQCTSCFRFAEDCTPQCKLCRDTSRDSKLLLIVEKDQDVTAIEKTGLYKGLYFVLGGTLTLSRKVLLREKELKKRVEDLARSTLTEIIFGFSATTEGEMTTAYIRDLLTPYRATISFTLLGRGLATGSELEYADKDTLQSAYIGRTAL